MSIRLEDLDATDFGDVATGRQLQPVRPGDILLHDFMEPLGLSANALAAALQVPANRITGILAASRRVTADTALRLSRYFGTTPQFWMNLQTNFDLKLTEAKAGDRIAREVACRVTA
jgi:addiction module HigA family antidote